jgi:hypothetical protein
MDKKIKQKEVGLGKDLHWKWDEAPKVENSCQNNVLMFEKTLKFKQIILWCYWSYNRESPSPKCGPL